MILDKWSIEVKRQKSKVKIVGIGVDSSCFGRFWEMLKSERSTCH